jgi:tRNA1Val (adenine37-N6)-methyltransferase
MKVGTDGVLLGAWANTEDAGRILDAGTGTGLIAIMMAQRSEALIDAVEIDEEAFIQARENAAACPWKDRIRVYHNSLQQFVKELPGPYDVIVSNPPYFRKSLKPPSAARSLARHDDRLSYESLLFCSAQALAKQGRLAVIIPAAEITRLTEIAYFHGLYPSQQVMIKPLPDKKPSRCLAEFTNDRNKPCVEAIMVIRNEKSSSYTETYKNLTKDYYL